jgi:hypothetical protein
MLSRSAAGPRRAGLALLPPLLLAVTACTSSTGGPTPTPTTGGPSASRTTIGMGVSPGQPSPTGVYDDNLSHHPTTYGTPGPGYPTATAPPPPAGTFTPSPNAWDPVHPPAGFTVTLVAAAHDPQAAVTAASVRAWAREESADLTVTMVAKPADNLVDLSRAIRAKPDLIMTAGDSLVDAMALVTASATDTRFLILGAEIAEPTDNVTAVDWLGAGYRGEGLGKPATHRPASFTPDRTLRAVRAGVAAVLTNWSGLVVWIG